MKYLLLIFLYSYPLILSAQLTVKDVSSVSQAVQQLAGDGVVISNVTYFYEKSSFDDSPIGTFTDLSQTIGLSGGLLMTTGSAKLAGGINDQPSSGQQNRNSTQYSSELNTLVFNESFKDLCIVEFDISVSSELLEFRYVFGSEEYLEYVNEYNDVFGFFISGPGINGVKNIAVVPGTNIPVSINTINNNVNSVYYVDNGDGLGDGVGSVMQYDGYTTPLTAEIRVTPCQTYHIKLIISDVRDALYDSGVFIEANSFSSQNTPTVEILYEYDRYAYAVEGCNDVKIKITRGAYDLTQLSQTVEYFYTFEGNAIEGEDFSTSLNSNVFVIPQGESSFTFDIHINSDNIEEVIEYVDFILTSGCSTFEKKHKKRFQIYDEYLYGLQTQVACLSQSSIINVDPKYEDDLFWYSTSLSCQSCTSPYVTQDTSKWYVFDAVDPLSGCTTTDSVFVIVLNMTADFEITVPECYTSQDRYFENTSQTADHYVWSFGDGEGSAETSPSHLYGEWFNEENKSTYEVMLIAENEQYRCIDTITKTVAIDEMVFIPNVMTPNGDRKNEFLEINGFVGECWLLGIYDRWGSLVYETQDYQNDWNGGDLSDGVYYYEIINDKEDRQFRGTLLIVR